MLDNLPRFRSFCKNSLRMERVEFIMGNAEEASIQGAHGGFISIKPCLDY